MKLALGLAASLWLAAVTHSVAAQPSASDAAAQLAGLFMQSCLPYAGNPAALRAWARRTGLPTLPDPARAAFLHGAPGMVFDASTGGGKYVLASSDDGICSAITDAATDAAVVAALEDDLHRIGVAFRRVIERDDKQVGAVHYREYLAAKDGRGWRILAATVKDAGSGQAMLTAEPE
jgi:hypothetical protein